MALNKSDFPFWKTYYHSSDMKKLAILPRPVVQFSITRISSQESQMTL